VMQNGGAALMGTARARREPGEEAAQQAISSRCFDNISIAGATGVLINITGGEDMTLGEVTQISEAIHDAAGTSRDHFGAVNDPRCTGVRITVIATGFEQDRRHGGSLAGVQRPAAGVLRSAIARRGDSDAASGIREAGRSLAQASGRPGAGAAES